MGRTLFNKLWDDHVVEDLGDGWSLLHIDRHLLHDLSGGAALAQAESRNFSVADPDLVFATPDHAVSSAPDRTPDTFPTGGRLWRSLKALTEKFNVRLFDLDQPGQGIVHVMAPELGLVQPGVTLICGDSHTCTNGALGALAFGVGTTESCHALVSSMVRLRRLKQMRLYLEGELGQGVSAKDVILHVIGRLGAASGVEHAVEYCGPAVETMDIEARLTLCNLTVELGARSGIIAPDEKTITYLKGRRFSPEGALFDQAAEHWRTLRSDSDAAWDQAFVFDVNEVAPTVTWGTSPEHAISIGGRTPDPEASDPAEQASLQAALDYMGLKADQKIEGIPIDRVFIGSCTNARLSDLRLAADLVRGRRIAPGVTAWVVPGSVLVKQAAEAEGLDQIFIEAGFNWRQPGCSMCVAANGEVAPPGSRVVSTSNRNFVGRQGRGARTHLASPTMAAAAALTGEISDVRRI